MPLGIFFWILLILAVLLTGFWGWAAPANRLGAGAWLLFFLALVCLGWKVFGPVVQ